MKQCSPKSKAAKTTKATKLINIAPVKKKHGKAKIAKAAPVKAKPIKAKPFKAQPVKAQKDKWWSGCCEGGKFSFSFGLLTKQQRKDAALVCKKNEKKFKEVPTIVTKISGPKGGSRCGNPLTATYAVNARVKGTDLVDFGVLRAHAEYTFMKHLLGLYDNKPRDEDNVVGGTMWLECTL
jgi:hypothetical protein